MNPWGLTERQADTMNAMCKHGDCKLAADALGVTVQTVERHMAAIAKRMPHRTRLLRILTWDRLVNSTPQR